MTTGTTAITATRATIKANCHDAPRGRRHRRAGVVAAASAAAVSVLVASAAWACAPGGHTGHDGQTYFGSCGAPEGSTKACKPLLNTPAFPEATAIKGPPGSRFWAYVKGGPMLNNAPYDLMFASKTLLANGGNCHNDPSLVIGGPTIANNGGIPPTLGTIPANAPLGKGQVCFSDSPAHTGKYGEGHQLAGHNLPGIFKVVI